ncbi:hypothetical protein NUW58_g7098 [Xylaria curta]|uniref:Uncharacterized protein n=1 Tax=Xylaria curta TaxID=42375 RepID=A0ACC1NLV9_9PEZI|nr:hypothetical protein NUW58_g7098 [Xylaria curta]
MCRQTTPISQVLGRAEAPSEKLEESIEQLLAAKTRCEEWYIFDETTRDMRPGEKEANRLIILRSSAAYNAAYDAAYSPSYNAKTTEYLAKLEQKDKQKIGCLAHHSDFEISSP